MPLDDWAGPDGELGRYISEQAQRTLNAYREQPDLIVEHAAVEEDTAQGGYQHRQLLELIQNSADALAPLAASTADMPEAHVGGRIEVRLGDDVLYCADDGAVIDREGLRALMFSHLSPKRATDQIGTFGLGFKSVLGVSAAPEFFSRSGSFRFDARRSREQLQALTLGSHRYPALRLPEPVDPADFRDSDDNLREMMVWANNIVRLPLHKSGYSDLHQQMKDFPAEFLLFVEHVKTLVMADGTPGLNRALSLDSDKDGLCLNDAGSISRWKLFKRVCQLSAAAREDQRSRDERTSIPLCWAAPVDRLDQPGKFWAFFPTHTASLVAGILNAPWKTNEDRQNLLPGDYNEELIKAAADMIAGALPELTSRDDPARHLDALPRRYAPGDTAHAEVLRNRLYAVAREHAILPDQDGVLCYRTDVSVAPDEATAHGSASEVLDLWAAFDHKPADWLHHTALTRVRLATIDRLFHPDQRWRVDQAPRAACSEWLEALVSQAAPGDEAAASSAAISIAGLLHEDGLRPEELGRIVFTANGRWRKPDPDHLFLPVEDSTVGSTNDPESSVHLDVTSNKTTLDTLKKLGLKTPSAETRFRMIALSVLRRRGASDEERRGFWSASRGVKASDAHRVIRELVRDTASSPLCVLTRSGSWMRLYSALMPGSIVPEDGSRDDEMAVDLRFHAPDQELLSALGLEDQPRERNLSAEPAIARYEEECREQYRDQDNLLHTPRSEYLKFTKTQGIGPLHVLSKLSEEGRALYTDALLDNDACYFEFEMWHTGTNKDSYPKVSFPSLAIEVIREHGRIRTPEGIVPFDAALGPHPDNASALHTLLQHRQADKIKDAFDLTDPTPEFFGEHEPIPLTDVWPGLKSRLPDSQRSCRLIRCDRITVGLQEQDCILAGTDVYIRADVADDEKRALRLVLGSLNLNEWHIKAILEHRTAEKVEQARAAVRQCSADAERLAAAVGQSGLRAGLPSSLLEILDSEAESPTDADIAEAAIATYDTGALWQFRQHLRRLNPPEKWAGSQRAIKFVQSLGFSSEWAGTPKRRRPAWEVVDGPRTLPGLHDYQNVVAENLRALLRSERSGGDEGRGMISLPTGSGKTRVAVQAIVEAIRDRDLRGAILWIADRDELCEQAVEAWRHVWSSIGSEAVTFRVSRMWSGQPPPVPATERHVVVATLQTAHSRLTGDSRDYDFLRQVELIVFDEAHRSIAPTATSVLGEVGLTFRRRSDEPFLIGLTATPYRGYDAEETARLVRRYGNNRLDAGAFSDDDPQAVIRELQHTQVLARADHETIEGGTFRLDDDELEVMSRFARGTDQSVEALVRAWLPESAERRIAQNPQRTRRIIGAYKTHIERDWPTLIYATSVEHAQTLAALLNREGVRARAVSGTTESSTRRRVVEQFRNGELKALVNYAVFREGFDAPKTRAIVVARPVYSPNLYFQMVGRGLRGPKNGGDERCLILNVEDNIENFDRALAFAELDWLWAA